MDNREANIYQHPPACTCVDCCRIRLSQQRENKLFDPRFNSDNTVDIRFSPSKYVPRTNNASDKTKETIDIPPPINDYPNNEPQHKSYTWLWWIIAIIIIVILYKASNG